LQASYRISSADFLVNLLLEWALKSFFQQFGFNKYLTWWFAQD